MEHEINTIDIKEATLTNGWRIRNHKGFYQAKENFKGSKWEYEIIGFSDSKEKGDNNVAEVVMWGGQSKKFLMEGDILILPHGRFSSLEWNH